MNLGDNTDPRSGLVVRNDLSLAGKGTATGYVTLTTSPSGTFLQWDIDGNGFLDSESAKVAAATWPVQLRLERTDAGTVTGSWRASSDQPWSVVGPARERGGADVLDAGVYAAGNNQRGASVATFTGTRFVAPTVPEEPVEPVPPLEGSLRVVVGQEVAFSDAGYEPGETVQVVLHVSGKGRTRPTPIVLGTSQADAGGTIVVRFVVPDVRTGWHELVLDRVAATDRVVRVAVQRTR